MALPVQFRGAENVVKAYENLGVTKWAIFNGKTLNEKYEGEDFATGQSHLRAFLEMMVRASTMSVYTLCTYEDLKKGQKIKPSTECDRAFNFTVADPDYYPTQGRTRTEQLILERLDKIEAQRAIKEDDETDEQKISGVEKYFSFLLEMPGVKERIGQTIAGFLDKILPMNNPGSQFSQPAAINGLPPNDQAQLQKVQSALEILVQHDSEIGDHLLAIARVAQNDPEKYKNLIGMLKLL